MKGHTESQHFDSEEQDCIASIKTANELEGNEKSQALARIFMKLGDIYQQRGVLLKDPRQQLKAITLYQLALAYEEQFLELTTVPAVTEGNMDDTNSGQGDNHSISNSSAKGKERVYDAAYKDEVGVDMADQGSAINDPKLSYLRLSERQKILVAKIKEIEDALIQSFGGHKIEQDLEMYWETWRAVKEKLNSVRKQAKAELTLLEKKEISVQKIYQNIAKGLKSLMSEISESCMNPLPHPEGCIYSIIALGSLARAEATPYSDFEFAILFQDKGEEKNKIYKEYFRKLTYLIWLKVLNLGETTARMMDMETLNCIPEKDSSCKKGFSFDGQMEDGCHTPLGNLHHTLARIKSIEGNTELKEEELAEKIQAIYASEYELIGTPYELAQFQTEQWESKRGFNTVLSTADTIISNDVTLEQKLLQIYEAEMALIWDKEDRNSGLKLIQRRSLDFLAESVERFQFRGGKFDKECHYFDAKYHLYRLPNMLIDHLASYFGVKERSLWERVDSIFGSTGKVVNIPGSIHLKKSISLIMKLRLVAYSNKGYRDDHIILLATDEVENNLRLLDNYLGISSKSLLKIFSVLVPFHAVMKKFLEKKGQEKILTMSEFYDNSPFIEGFVYELLLDYKRSLRAYKNAIENISDPYSSKYADILNNLGCVYSTCGQFHKAFAMLQKAKAINKALYGQCHSTVADTLHNIGIIYHAYSQFYESIATYEEVIRIRKALYGNIHQSIASVLDNLGNVYQKIEKYAEAITMFEQAIEIQRKLFRWPTVSLAGLLNNLGIVYREQAKYKNALDMFNNSKEVYINFCGSNHILTSYPLVNMGNIYALLSLHAEALSVYKEARAIRINSLGKVHGLVAEVLGNMGNVYYNQKLYDEAIRAHQEAKEIFTAVYHQDHPLVADELTGLGNVYRLQGKYAEAEAAHRESLRIKKAAYGMMHSSVAITLNNLGNVYAAQGENYFSKAISKYRKAIRIFINASNKHPALAFDTVKNLHRIYKLQKRDEAIIALYEEIKPAYINQYGLNHKVVADLFNVLGNLYKQKNLYVEAIDSYKNLIKSVKKVNGADDISLVEGLNALGEIYRAQLRFQKAIKLYRQINEIYRKIYNDTHNLISQTLNTLGSIYLEQTNYDQALEIYKKVEQLRIIENGPEHPLVAGPLCNLGLVYVEQGKFSEARSCYQRAIELCKKFKHPSQRLLETNMNISYLREGNAFLLQEPTNFLEASTCYAKAGIEDSPLLSDLHQKLADHFYEKNSLIITYEHYKIITKLNPQSAIAYHNLGCMIHIIAQLKREQGDEDGYVIRVNEVNECFQHAIKLNYSTSTCTDYAQFMLRNYSYYPIDTPIDYLLRAIQLKQLDSHLVYGIMERPTVDAVLQTLIDKEKRIIIRAYFLAHYLLVKSYLMNNQTEEAQRALDTFKEEVENYKSKTAQPAEKAQCIVEELIFMSEKMLQSPTDSSTQHILYGEKLKNEGQQNDSDELPPLISGEPNTLVEQQISYIKADVRSLKRFGFFPSLKSLCFQTLWHNGIQALPSSHNGQMLPDGLDEEYVATCSQLPKFTI